MSDSSFGIIDKLTVLWGNIASYRFVGLSSIDMDVYLTVTIDYSGKICIIEHILLPWNLSFAFYCRDSMFELISDPSGRVIKFNIKTKLSEVGLFRKKEKWTFFWQHCIRYRFTCIPVSGVNGWVKLCEWYGDESKRGIFASV
jgi:hypothetical protein